MNNMQFDEATQTYRGRVSPYRWDGEGQEQFFSARHKPLQVTPQCVARAQLDILKNYWIDQAGNQEGGEPFAAKSLAYMGRFQNPTLTQRPDSALQQLIQAMAGFVPPQAGSTGGPLVGACLPMQMWRVDGGS